MDYIDDEEQERKLTKKNILRLIVFILATLIIILAVFFFMEGLRQKKDEADEKKVMKEAAAKEEPFILDDVKEEIAPERHLEEKKKQEEISIRLTGSKEERVCEYTEIDLPELVEKGNMVDVRLSLADGRDYSVLVSKKLDHFLKKDGKEYTWLSLKEEEILAIESALSDLRLFRNARLYAAIHNSLDAEKIMIDYPVNAKSRKLMEKKQKEGDGEKRFLNIRDKELDEDRKRLIELGASYAANLKETAAYWNNE